MKKLLVLCSVLFSMSALASNEVFFNSIVRNTEILAQDQAETLGLNWNVGDACHYKLSMGGFINGKMDMIVREKTAEGIWLDQNMDLGFAGKQNVQILLDPNTGAVKKMLVNGKEQAPPEQDIEVIEVKEDEITVPAGTFKAVYIKAKDKKENKEIEQWANPKAVPISGMIKSLAPSQLGKVNVELTSFERK